MEEALIARGLWDRQNSNNLTKKSSLNNETKMNNLYSKYNELDELISDKGIIYNTKRYTIKSDNSSSINEEDYNEDLFKQFKQFILFKKMIDEKK